MSSPRSKARSQRGAALIVALLVVAMVVMLATALSSDFLLMFRRVENQLYSEQAYAYMRGAEALSRAALVYDLEIEKQVAKERNDNLTEDWAQPQQYPTDYGWIGGQLEDLQSRFNLNSLTISGPQQPGTYSVSQKQLIRLLLALRLEEPLALDQAQALTDAITDWIDTNSEVSGLSGAESEFYESADPAGRPANRALAGPSELMMVKGMTPAIFRALAPLVTVWPTTGGNGININTAAVEVLRSLGNVDELQPLTDGEVEVLLEAREPPKFVAKSDVEKILKSGVFANRKAEVTAVVESNYFLLNTVTDFQGHRYAMRSILYRTSEGKTKIDVIARSFGDW